MTITRKRTRQAQIGKKISNFQAFSVREFCALPDESGLARACDRSAVRDAPSMRQVS